MEKVLTLLIAVVLDVLFGEPPRFIHPTVWFGKIVELVDRRYVRKNCRCDFFVGTLLAIGLVIFALSLAHVKWLEFYLLFTSISIRSMIDHAKRTIKDGKILREEVQKIVSRDTSKLNDNQLSSAVIESIAENFVDGVFAPLFYYTLFGVPGAMIYRAINTCDAMIGYRTRRYEYFGKFCARLDDILNFIPARLSVLLFLLLRPSALKVIKRYRKIKLNGGYSISAMAGVLNVTLIKPGQYEVRAGRLPELNDIERAIKVYIRLSMIAVTIYTLINLPVGSIMYLPNLGFISGIELCSTPMR